MTTTQTTRIAYGRKLCRALAAFTLLAGLAAPALENDSRNTVWINCAAILCYVGLERVAVWLWPGRILSLLRATLFLAAAGPVFLIVAIFIEGDPAYLNMAGRFYHTGGSWLVALAGVMLHGFALLGAALAGRQPSGVDVGLGELSLAFSKSFLRLVSWLVWIHAALRLMVLFFLAELPQPIVYVSRLYLSYFLALFVFLGIGLRANMPSARLAGAATLLVSATVLLSGGRSDALYPILFVAVGFVLAKPIDGRSMVRWTAIAIPAFLLAMYAGGLVREDARGRTGDAVIERAGDLGSALHEGDNRSSAVEVTIRRMISNSTHSVITRIPSEVPFEEDGIGKLPAEMLERLLPRLNLGGTSDTEQPRNWMLNELGFLVNWATSVELSLVADAWYRGGFGGLVVIGMILGLVFQLLENGVYFATQRRPQFSVLLVFLIPWLLPIQGRDIVEAGRTVIFVPAMGLLLVGVARLMETRSRGRLSRVAPGYRGRPDHATVGP